MDTKQAFEVMRASINRGTNGYPSINAADLDAVVTIERSHERLVDLARMAVAFTMTIERYLNPPDDGRTPPTESEVAAAMYQLRGTAASIGY